MKWAKFWYQRLYFIRPLTNGDLAHVTYQPIFAETLICYSNYGLKARALRRKAHDNAVCDRRPGRSKHNVTIEFVLVLPLYQCTTWWILELKWCASVIERAVKILPLLTCRSWLAESPSGKSTPLRLAFFTTLFYLFLYNKDYKQTNLTNNPFLDISWDWYGLENSNKYNTEGSFVKRLFLLIVVAMI